MMRLHALFLLSVLYVRSNLAHAADATPPGAGSMLQVTVGLLIVLGLMVAMVWAMKRFGVAGPSATNVVKLVGGINVSNRERIMVIEVADQWIVVGVAPGRLTSLATMPSHETGTTAPVTVPPNFAAWLKHTIDKRNNGKQQ